MNYTSPTQNVLRVIRVHENRAVKGAGLLKQDVQKLNFSTNDDYAQSCLFLQAKTIFSREITLFFKVESQSFFKVVELAIKEVSTTESWVFSVIKKIIKQNFFSIVRTLKIMVQSRYPLPPLCAKTVQNMIASGCSRSNRNGRQLAT